MKLHIKTTQNQSDLPARTKHSAQEDNRIQSLYDLSFPVTSKEY